VLIRLVAAAFIFTSSCSTVFLPVPFRIFGVSQNTAHINSFDTIDDCRDQPVLVAGDVEHRASAN